MSLTRLQIDGSVAELTLCRPHTGNALSAAVVDEMLQRLGEIEARADVHVVVLAGEGRHFCTGMDLAEASTATPEQVSADAGRIVGLCQAIRQSACPIIARVQGAVSAAGLQLVLFCDLVYSDDGATFATPGARVGMWCMTPMVPLVRSIGTKAATEMLLLGLPITAARAMEIGLINGTFPAGSLRDEVLGIARILASRPPQVIALGKRVLREQEGASLGDAYALALDGVRTNASLPDAHEGMNAFLGKRMPGWRARARSTR